MDIFKILVKGTKVVLTSTKIKEGKTSAIQVGEIRSGTLSKEFEFGKPLYFEETQGPITGIMFSIEMCKKKIILESETSYYEIRVIKDGNDIEFQQWLHPRY